MLVRRVALLRMEGGRSLCMTHPAFLAALGGLWLDDGEPEQALIWLERSLLLEPHNLGAQADHAMALAALGQPDAARELAASWRDRPDIPTALRNKLLPDLLSAATLASAPLPKVRLGGSSDTGWVSRLEVTALLGHENNLDHAPRLDELTLTTPLDGPITLPVATVPRRGVAALADLSWQWARRTNEGQVWRAEVSLASRSALKEHATDWNQVLWTLSASQQWGPWRGSVNADAAWIGGALNEPYRSTRLRLTVDRDAAGCAWLAGMEAENRAQSRTASANSNSLGLLWTATCPVPFTSGWSFSGAVRKAIDRPSIRLTEEEAATQAIIDQSLGTSSTPTIAVRPGGIQRSLSIGLRVQGRLGDSSRVDINLRTQSAADDDGYNQLLESNARRQTKQTQLSIELSRPLGLTWAAGLQGVLQLSALEQRSNLVLFRNHGASIYSGVRWAW